jgi:hypothetical protein
LIFRWLTAEKVLGLYVKNRTLEKVDSVFKRMFGGTTLRSDAEPLTIQQLARRKKTSLV